MVWCNYCKSTYNPKCRSSVGTYNTNYSCAQCGKEWARHGWGIPIMLCCACYDMYSRSGMKEELHPILISKYKEYNTIMEGVGNGHVSYNSSCYPKKPHIVDKEWYELK